MYGRFVKGALLFAAVVTVIAILAFAIWNKIESSKLQAELEATARAGQSLKISELVPPPVPDAFNGALVLQRAWLAAADDVGVLDDLKEKKPGALEKAEALVAAKTDIFARIDEALRLPECRFPIAYEDGYSALIPHVSELLKLAKLQAIECRVKMERGDAAGARLSALRLVKFSAVLRKDYFVVGFLVREVMFQIGLECLQLSCESGLDAEAVAVTKGAGAGLKDHLLAAVRMERAAAMSIMTDLVDGKLPEGLGLSVSKFVAIRPVIRRDTVHLLKYFAASIEMFNVPFWNRGPLEARLQEFARETMHPISSIVVPEYVRTFRREAELESWVKAVEVALSLDGTAIDPLTGGPFVIEKAASGTTVKSSCTGGDPVIWRITPRPH